MKPMILYDDFEKTPIMYAIEENQVEVRKLLDPFWAKAHKTICNMIAKSNLFAKTG